MISRALMKASVRDLRRRTWALWLMLVGVALGVAVVVAIDLANTSARTAFRLSTESVIGRTTHRILGGPSGIDSAEYVELQSRPLQADLAPVIEDFAGLPSLGGRIVSLLGVDPLKEAPFRDLLPLTAAPNQGSLTRLYTDPGTVILSAQLASEMEVELGDSIVLQLDGVTQSVEVLGIVAAEGDGYPSDLLLMDIATAQELTGRQGRISRIDVIAGAAQAERIRQSLPQGLSLVAASQQAETAAQLSSAFQLNLTALSLLALVVGMFLIYNTIMFSVVQRRPVLATLRALGVTPEGVFAMIAVESLAIGILGSALGLALGWVLGQGAVRLVTQTINDFYFVVTVREAPLQVGTVVKGVLLGLGSSLLAAAGPALEAARVSPIEALRRSSLEKRVRHWIPWANALGITLTLSGVAMLLLIPASLTASFAGMFGILLGMALFAPFLTIRSMPWLGPLLGTIFGVVGALAARTIVRAISRTSVAIAALMVALSVTIGVGIMIDSFRTTVENWLDLTLRADLYVSAPTGTGTRPSADLDPNLKQSLEAIAGVAAVETFRAVTVSSEFGETQLSVADSSRDRDSRLYRFAAGTPAQVWDQVRQGAVIVSETYAYRHGGLMPGSTLVLETSRGAQAFPVAAVYYDYASDRGTVLMADAVYRQNWDDDAISSLGLYLEEGADLAQVAQRVRSSLAATGLLVQANRSIRQQALQIFDRTFAITAALRLLAVVVAFFGVLSAILALQLERRREMATLQALGLPLKGMWGLTTLESGLMGFMAGLLSLPSGWVLALILIYVINLRSFGWSIEMNVNPWLFVQALLVSVTAATLAAIYPMLRLDRLELAAALRAE